MKKIIFISLLASLNVMANESLIQLLEENEFSTEAYQSYEPIEVSGEQLKINLSKLIKLDLLMQYTVTGHDTDTGLCLEQSIVELLNSDDGAIDTTIMGHCGGVFDPPGSAIESVPINGSNLHDLRHQRNIILVRRMATFECNNSLRSSAIQIPVFTAPQHLVDVIYGLNIPNKSYHLSDGVTFHCMKPQRQSIQTTH